MLPLIQKDLNGFNIFIHTLIWIDCQRTILFLIISLCHELNIKMIFL